MPKCCRFLSHKITKIKPTLSPKENNLRTNGSYMIILFTNIYQDGITKTQDNNKQTNKKTYRVSFNKSNNVELLQIFTVEFSCNKNQKKKKKIHKEENNI